MLPHLQRRFADSLFGTSKHESMLHAMHQELGRPIEFRVMEAPVFCSHDLREQIAQASVALVKQCAQPRYKAQSEASLQDRYRVRNESEHTTFAVVDFAVSVVNGRYVPRLVELQGFPSLFCYQQVLSDWFHKSYDLSSELSPFFQELHRDDYLHLLHEVIVGGELPEHVGLLELRPYTQKTLPDFLATKNFLGIEPVDILAVEKSGDKLFYTREGVRTQLRRVYNRAIVDELEDAKVSLAFSWGDNLDVRWVGHPNWYFRMSKYSLPFLQHETLPQCSFVSDLSSIPDDLSNYVLKPLYAFAGKGVNVEPTRADVEAITESERANWVLMEKIDYAECVYTPLGMNKLEVRCMVVWPDGADDPIPTINLIRSGRAAMMGARYNTVEWSGATIAFFGEE